MSNEIVTEIIALILQDLPESFVFTLMIFSLAKIRYQAKPIIWIASLMALINLIVRHLPIAFGVHTIILIFAYVALTWFFTKQLLSKIFLCVMITTACIVAAEAAYSIPLLNWVGMTYEECYANPLLRAAFALPGEIFVLLLALGINFYHKKRRNYDA